MTSHHHGFDGSPHLWRRCLILSCNTLISAGYVATAAVANRFLLERVDVLINEERLHLGPPSRAHPGLRKSNSTNNFSFSNNMPATPTHTNKTSEDSFGSAMKDTVVLTGTGFTPASKERRLSASSPLLAGASEVADWGFDPKAALSDGIVLFYGLIVLFCVASSISLSLSAMLFSARVADQPEVAGDSQTANGISLTVGILLYNVCLQLLLKLFGLTDRLTGRGRASIKTRTFGAPLLLNVYLGLVYAAMHLSYDGNVGIYLDVILAYCLVLISVTLFFYVPKRLASVSTPTTVLRRVRFATLALAFCLGLRASVLLPPVQSEALPSSFLTGFTILTVVNWLPVGSSMAILRAVGRPNAESAS